LPQKGRWRGFYKSSNVVVHMVNIIHGRWNVLIVKTTKDSEVGGAAGIWLIFSSQFAKEMAL
jgi:hypothetical protein